MKFILSLVTVAFFSALSFANVTQDNEYLLNHEDITAQKTQLGTLVNRTQNMIVARYSFAVQGGSSTGEISLLTNLQNSKSFASLPANAIITNVWLDSITQPTSGGANTGKISIRLINTGDVVANSLVTNSYKKGQQQGVPQWGTSTTWIKIGASGSSTVKATVTINKLTAGKFNVYLSYVLGDNTN